MESCIQGGTTGRSFSDSLIETLADKVNRLLEDELADKNTIRKIQPDIYKMITSHIKSIRPEISDKDKNLVSALSWEANPSRCGEQTHPAQNIEIHERPRVGHDQPHT